MVECPYCNKSFKKITNTHLKQVHSISYLQYLKEYKKEEYYYKYIADWIMNFYKPNIGRCIEQIYDERIREYKWVTRYTYSCREYKEEELKNTEMYTREYKNIMGKRNWNFNKNDIIGHLKKETTYGIYVYERASYFLLFDIDIFNPRILLYLFYTLIKLGIQQNEILMSWSGSKGYHLTVFFDKAVTKEDLKLFFNIVLLKAGILENNERCNGSPIVEARGVNSQAVKLPLGNNNKETVIKCGDVRVKSSNKFCFLTNELGEEIDILSKLESMKKIEKKRILKIIDMYREEIEVNTKNNIKMHKENDIESKDTINEFEDVINSIDIDKFKINKEGINNSIELLLNKPIEAHNRNKTLLKIAIYNKSKGMAAEENIQFLKEFSSNKIHNFRTSIKENNEEIKNIVKTIYFSPTANKYNIRATLKDIKYTKDEIFEILSVKEEKLRKIYFCIYTHFKMYGNKQTKEFYITYDRLKGLLNINGKEINKRLIELEKLGKLRFIVKGKKDKDSKGKENCPNKYYLVYNVEKDNGLEKYKLFCKNNKLDNIIYVNFKMTCAKVLTNKEIKNNFKNYKDVVKYKYQQLKEIA